MVILVRVTPRPPYQHSDLVIDLSGDYKIDVGDDLTPEAAAQEAIATCCEHLDIDGDRRFLVTIVSPHLS